MILHGDGRPRCFLPPVIAARSSPHQLADVGRHRPSVRDVFAVGLLPARPGPPRSASEVDLTSFVTAKKPKNYISDAASSHDFAAVIATSHTL